MSAPQSTSNASTDSTGLLGLREMSGALELWQTHPGPESQRQLVSAFGSLIASSGLGGGYLHLHCPAPYRG